MYWLQGEAGGSLSQGIQKVGGQRCPRGQADGLRKCRCCWCELSVQEYACGLTVFGKGLCEFFGISRTTLKELIVLLSFLFFSSNGTKN